MRKIELYEVGPRDGFQMVDDYIPLETKARIVEGLLDAGLRHVQMTSFVSPKAIPQMKDAGELASMFVGKYPDADLFALVPNLRGAEAAAAKIEQRQKTFDNSAFPAGTLIGNTKRDPQCLIDLGGKNGMNIRCICVHIRCHDNDVFWHQIRIVFKHGQQIIMQHLDFPHGAVAGMNLNGVVLSGQSVVIRLKSGRLVRVRGRFARPIGPADFSISQI